MYASPSADIPRGRDWARTSESHTDAVQARDLKAKFTPLGVYPVGTCGTQFAALIRKQYDDIGRIVREANIKAE